MTLKTSQPNQKEIDRSMQKHTSTDNNVWEDKSEKEVITNSEILRERETATENFLDRCGTIEDTTPGKGIEISALGIVEEEKPKTDTSGTGRMGCRSDVEDYSISR